MNADDIIYYGWFFEKYANDFLYFTQNRLIGYHSVLYNIMYCTK